MVRYLGPADFVDGKPVPPEGLEITEAQRKGLSHEMHQFADASGNAEAESLPTPQEANNADQSKVSKK
jgi:hypothetical protein